MKRKLTNKRVLIIGLIVIIIAITFILPFNNKVLASKMCKYENLGRFSITADGENERWETGDSLALKDNSRKIWIYLDDNGNYYHSNKSKEVKNEFQIHYPEYFRDEYASLNNWEKELWDLPKAQNYWKSKKKCFDYILEYDGNWIAIEEKNYSKKLLKKIFEKNNGSEGVFVYRLEFTDNKKVDNSSKSQTCKYDRDGKELILTINTDTGAVSVNAEKDIIEQGALPSTDSNGDGVPDMPSYYYTVSADEKLVDYWKNHVDDPCTAVYHCDSGYNSLTGEGHFDLYKDELQANGKECDWLCVLGDKKCEKKCASYDEWLYGKKNSISTYYKNKDYSKAKNLELMVKQMCNSVMQTHNYTTSICLKKCLNMAEDIHEIKKSNGIDVADSSYDCGLSAQIIAFIYNILKWVKYIAPVLVIMLGILDFVKALAAQDDDAMKKAQGKFVKRLIAAVLLFLLPLIIDYVLSVFHLVNDSCNINKIF